MNPIGGFLELKQLVSLLLCCCMICFLTGCAGKGENQTIYYDIPGEPSNLDPQLANDTSSQIVLQNVMEGLFRMTSDGQLEEAAATSYEVSEDGPDIYFSLKRKCHVE